MSGLLSALGAQAGSLLGVQKGGLDPFILSDKPVPGAITTADMIDQPRGGTARWMFDETARQNGFDPQTVVKGGPEHQQVTRQLDAALHALKDSPLPKGEAAQTQTLRGAIREAVAADAPRLTAAQAATVATLPGAQTFSAPGAQAALRAAAAVARHPAAQAGLAAGAAGAIAVGGLTRRDEAAPQEKASAAPFAGMATKGERREDDTCAPKGTDGAWIVKAQKMEPGPRAYQRQISGTPELPGNLIVEYRVTSRAGGKPVDFDGCAVDRPGHPLLDAKYGYAAAFEKAEAGAEWAQKGIVDGLADQASRQVEITSGSHPVEWHASDAGAAPKIRFEQARGSEGAANMTVVHTPAVGVAR